MKKCSYRKKKCPKGYRSRCVKYSKKKSIKKSKKRSKLKRCSKGYRRDKITKLCVKKIEKSINQVNNLIIDKLKQNIEQNITKQLSKVDFDQKDIVQLTKPILLRQTTKNDIIDAIKHIDKDIQVTSALNSYSDKFNKSFTIKEEPILASSIKKTTHLIKSDKDVLSAIDDVSEKQATTEMSKLLTNKTKYLDEVRKTSKELYESMTLQELLVSVLGEYASNKLSEDDSISQLQILFELAYEEISIENLISIGATEEQMIMYDVQREELQNKYERYLAEYEEYIKKELEEQKKKDLELEQFMSTYQKRDISRIIEEYDDLYMAGMLLNVNDVFRYYVFLARSIQYIQKSQEKADLLKEIVKQKLLDKVNEAKLKKLKFIEL